MLPEEFIKRIEQQAYINSEGLFMALREPSVTAIRINRNKWFADPLNSRPVPWCKDGFLLAERPSFTLDPIFHAGCYYPQEASSMFLEEVFSQLAGDKNDIRVLDLCGAPGGKSTHLSSLIGRKGLLVSNEVIRHRASVLAENLTRWGLSNAVVTQNDPSSFNRLPGFFDLIFIDAPCSGEGMFRDMVAIKEWSLENTLLCSERQKRILMDVWPALKEGGCLVYSTCTFNPGENEKNIKWLTDRHEADSVILDILDYKEITEIDYEGVHGYGFYPGRVMGEGLFISVLRKTGSSREKHTGKKPSERQRITGDEKGLVSEWTHFRDDNIIKINDDVISIPGTYDDFTRVLKNLNLIKRGTIIGSVKRKNVVPDHELAMSVYFKKGSFASANLDADQALAFLSREHFLLSDVPEGWINVSYRGISLGFINNIGKRINNYYPAGWRIRMNTFQKGKNNIIKWL